MRVLTPRLLAVLDPAGGQQRRASRGQPLGSARSGGGSRISGTSATLGRDHSTAQVETARCPGRAANSAAPVMHSDAEETGLFDLLHTEKGFNAFEQWYRRLLASGAAVGASAMPHADVGLLWPQVYCPPNALHEHAFGELLRTFADCSDSEALDFFDLLDHENYGALGLPQVYMAICLVAAIGCRQLTKFAYFHSTALFGILAKGCRLCSPPEHVTWAKVLCLLRLLGAPGGLISRACVENDMTPLTQLKYDEFLAIMYPIMVQLDRGTDPGEITVINEGDRAGTVKSKMCTIL